MITLSVGEIVSLTGGRWTGSEDGLALTPRAIITDSRENAENAMFIAFRGENTDGHRYIPDVLAKGACAVLCEEEGGANEPRIVVPEVFAALRKLGSFCRSRMDIPVLGVTGSVGKTTAKEMCWAVLSAHFNTFKTPGSMNGQVGVPIALMGMAPDTQAAVIEMGISLPGEMAKLGEVVRPNMAVFMNIADAHLEALRNREGILEEKCRLLCASEDSAPVFVNGDDALLNAHDFGRRKISFGLGEHCEVRAIELESSSDGASQSCRILAPGRDFTVHIPAYGSYMVYAALAAASVGIELGLSDEEIAAGVRHYETVGHRSRIVRLSGGITLVDDCYNANPSSNRFAVDSMDALGGRKVCVLGEMREMGENSAQLHYELGRWLREKGVAAVYTSGGDSARIAAGAGDIAVHFASKAELISALPGLLRQGDTVLVKASHSCRFEDVVEALERGV